MEHTHITVHFISGDAVTTEEMAPEMTDRVYALAEEMIRDGGTGWVLDLRLADGSTVVIPPDRILYVRRHTIPKPTIRRD